MPITNTAQYNFEDLYTIFGASSMFNMDQSFSVKGVCTDTRLLEHGNLFVALAGENFDGHDYLSQAVEKGASAVLVSADKLKKGLEIPEGTAVIAARDTLTALGVLARYHRDRFRIPVVAIAGSNGKTTTKDISAHILSQKFSLLSTQKNYNNKIGTALTLLQLEPKHNACLLEIGTNEFGEIGYLSEISNPTHGLVTNIGAEHLQNFGDLDGVEMEETALYGYLRQQGGQAIVNVSDPRLDKYADHMEKLIAYSYDGQEAHIQADIQPSKDATVIKIKLKDEDEFSYKLPVRGRTSGINSVASFAIAMSLGMAKEEIVEALETYKPEKYKEGYGRMAIYEVDGNLIINDTYNANADSTLKALDTLAEEGDEREKIAVLGDMRELGELSGEEHQRVLDKALEIADKVILIGEEYGRVFEVSPKNNKLQWYPNVSKGKQSISGMVAGSGKAILYKGSRGMKMEELLK